MEQEGSNNRYIDNLEKHLDRSEKSADYSIQRFDILVILIAGGALVFSADYLNGNTDLSLLSLYLIKISWILFGITIMVNLASQLTGYYANKYEAKITTNLIRIERNKKLKGDQNKLENRKRVLDSSTIIFNFSSFVLLILGIILLMISIIN